MEVQRERLGGIQNSFRERGLPLNWTQDAGPGEWRARKGHLSRRTKGDLRRVMHSNQ